MKLVLNKGYAGAPSGYIGHFDEVLGTGLVAAGIASVSTGTETAGAQTMNLLEGSVFFAAGVAAATGLVVTCDKVDVSTKIYAVINLASPDTTALNVGRIVPAAGSFTIFLAQATTAIVRVDWYILNSSGEFPAYV